MAKESLLKEDLIEFINKYYEINDRVPKAKEWKEKDGFPCSRGWLHNKFLNKEYTYDNLIEESGFERSKPFNAKGGRLSKEELIQFIQKYKDKNGIVPCLKEWKEKDGFPCNKQYLANNYIYNELIVEAGFKSYEYGQRHYNIEELLADLRKAIIESRSFNIMILHKQFEYIKHRDIYANLFGEFENVLKVAGIENKHKILIQRFPDYKLEDPIEFVKNKFGENGEFTNEQKEIIETIKESAKGGDLRRETMQKKISIYKCIKLFQSYSIALIGAGLNPAKTMRTKITANDGDICDSYEECLVDNMLYDLNIEHEVHKRYPNSRCICDFYIKDNIYIEYIGFAKVKSNYIHERYMKKLEYKKNLVEKIGAKIIIIDKVDDSTVELIKKIVLPLVRNIE